MPIGKRVCIDKGENTHKKLCRHPKAWAIMRGSMIQKSYSRYIHYKERTGFENNEPSAGDNESYKSTDSIPH